MFVAAILIIEKQPPPSTCVIPRGQFRKQWYIPLIVTFLKKQKENEW